MGSSSRGGDVPGDSLASAKAYAQGLIRQAEALWDLEKAFDHLFERGYTVTGLSIRPPNAERDDYLVILRATTEAGKVVAFHDGATMIEALVGLAHRLKNGSLRWKEDLYG